MLDFDPEDIDGMDDDAGEEQEPPPTWRWIATSSYDIYMVDTPKEDNGEGQKEATNDDPLKKQPKSRRQRCRSKSRHSKNSDTGTRDNSTPDDVEDENNPTEPSFEQTGRENRQASPDEQAMNEDSEDGNYMPLSEDEVSLSDEEFTVPEDPVEQERFKRGLIVTAKSLKKK